MTKLPKHITHVVFDLAGTLSEEASWYNLTLGLGASVPAHENIFQRFESGELPYPTAKKELVQLWLETGNANRDFFKKLFESWKLMPNAKDTVDYLLPKYGVCVISGSVDLLVEIVATKLNIPHWFSNTRLIWDADGNLVDFHYHPNQSAEKYANFLSYIHKLNIDEQACAAVGDSNSDVELFKHVGYSVCLNRKPHPELESLATICIKDLSELKKIF